MDPNSISPWKADWVWGLPLIAGTVVIHAFALAFADERVSFVLNRNAKNRLPRRISALIMGTMGLFAAILHGFEATLWAAAYLLLGAIPDKKSAMLYSLNAMTSYGHTKVHLESHWELMGSLESLNGWIVFGLTTAFLFTLMQRVWPHANIPRHGLLN